MAAANNFLRFAVTILFVYIGSREFRGIFKRHPMEPGIKAEVPHSRDRRKKSQVCPQRSNSPRLSYKIARCVAGLNCYEFKQIHVSVCNSKLKHLEREIKFRIFKWKLSAITCVALFLMNKTLEQTVDNFFPCPWARTQTHFLYLIVLNDFGLEITVFLFSNTKCNFWRLSD